MNCQMKMCVGRGMGGSAERAPTSSLGTPASQHFSVSPTQKLFEPLHLGFLWRFHYVGVID